MFWFFKKKVNEDEIKAFSWAIQAINVYIALSDWEKARAWAMEVLEKEKESLKNYIENLDSPNKKLITKKEKDFEQKEKKTKSFIEQNRNIRKRI